MSGWVVASAVALTAAAWVAQPDGRWVISRRLVGVRQSASPRHAVAALIVVGVVALLSIVPSTTTRMALVACAGAGWFALRMQRSAAARAASRDFSTEVARVVRALSSELRAGVTPLVAVRSIAVDAGDAWNPLRRITAADVPAALRRLAEQPGGSGLADVAAAWEIADRSGAPLSGILGWVAEGVQDALDIDREVAAEAAPARATGKLMAVLPLVGLVLGTTLGANPVHVLLGTRPGLVCLVIGLALACTGLWWIDRVVRSVEQP